MQAAPVHSSGVRTRPAAAGFRSRRVRLVLAALWALLGAGWAGGWEPLRVHPGNPHLPEFRGRPTALITFGQHYSSVINAAFDYQPYLDVLERDGMNLTRVFLIGFRTLDDDPPGSPLSPDPADFIQPWPRAAVEQGAALDGLGKWDFSSWNEDYFTRLDAFVRACGDRGIVVELTLFSTFYSDRQWQSGPFHPGNNVQGFGPENRHDCLRMVDANLLAAQEAAVRRVVTALNAHDNIYYEIQNEPFWNQPGDGDEDEVAFHQRMLEIIRDEESRLPNRHLVAHNFPQQVEPLAAGFEVLNEHYPAAVPCSPVAGAEAMLENCYHREMVFALDETAAADERQTRVEVWMFLMGGGAIYNGLDAAHFIYSEDDESGDSPLGRSFRGTLRLAGAYHAALDAVRMRRDLSWFVGELPAGATLQAMSSPGQQYVAYLHHGSHSVADYQTVYDPIDDSEQSIGAVVVLDEGTWRAEWIRPADLAELAVEEFSHGGGVFALAPVGYREDVVLRIDRAGLADVTAPSAPGGLDAVSAADGAIILSWPAVRAHDLAFYHVYRADVPGVSLDEEHRVTILPATETGHVDGDAVVGTTYHYVVTAVDANGNESPASPEAGMTSSRTSTPYGGTARLLPGRVEAEDFDDGGQDLAYFDHTPGNDGGVCRDEDVDISAAADGGYLVLAGQPGEWLQYTVRLNADAEVVPVLRVANAAAGGAFRLEWDGVAMGDVVEVPETGGPETWREVELPEVALGAGTHRLRLVMTAASKEGGAGSFDWISFVPLERTGPTADAGADMGVVDADGDGHATVVLDGRSSVAGDAPIISHIWMEGATVIASGENPAVEVNLGRHEILLRTTDANGLSDDDEVVVTVTARGFLNGSFEQGFMFWQAQGNQTVQSAAPYVPTDGAKLVAFNSGNLPPDAVLSQSFATVSGRGYTLSFDAGVLAYNTNTQNLKVEVSGGGTLLSKTVTLTGPGGGKTRWWHQEHAFTADGDLTKLVFADRSTATKAIDLLIDNVRVAEAPLPGNTAPRAADDSYATSMGSALVLPAPGVLANDTDAEMDPLSVVLDIPPVHGSVILNVNGGFTYLPEAGYAGGDSFSYHVTDGWLPSNVATVRVSVTRTVREEVFPAVRDKVHLVRFRVLPSAATGSVPPMSLTIIGTGVLKTVDLQTALPAGAESVPYVIPVIPDSDCLELRFTARDAGATAEQIGDLVVAEPLTAQPATGPNARQLAQIRRRYGMFVHFGVNTFNNIEWSDGTKPASSYRPTSLDVDQWARTACEAGMRYMILTTKHHDGFCLWDSPWTSYDVASSPVRHDVIAAAAAACRKYGIGLALYHSLWDRHEPSYANDAAYNQYLLRQLEELMSHYGPVCELWLDGGWDKPRDRWPLVEIYELVRRLQPDCQVAVNQTIGLPSAPDSSVPPAEQREGYPIRYFPADFRLWDPALPANPDPKVFSHGGGLYYLPFEATVTLSAANKWFYHATDTVNKTVEQLAVIHQSATSQDNMLVLNAPPDTSGRIRDIERASLFGLRDRLGLVNGVGVPFGGAAWMLPGVIQCEDYDSGGPDVGYHDLTPANDGGACRPGEGVDTEPCTDEGGGFAVAATLPGEWLKYTVDVAAAGEHVLGIRLASPEGGGRLSVEIDGVPVADAMMVPATGGPDDWQTVLSPSFHLDEGSHILGLIIEEAGPDGSAGALNWISVGLVPKPGPTAHAGADLACVDQDGDGSAEVVLDGSASFGGDAAIVDFVWLEGDVTVASGVQAGCLLALGRHVIRLRVTDALGRQDDDEVVVTVAGADLINGSFEDGYRGWSVAGNQSIYSAAPYAATDGSSVVAFNPRDLAPDAVLSQGLATVAGRSYVLSFDLGVLSYNTSTQTLRVTVDGATNLLDRPISMPGRAGGACRWLAQDFTFVADGGFTMITFRDLSTATKSIDLLLDHVRVGLRAARLITVHSYPEEGALVSVSPPDESGASAGTTPFGRTHMDGAKVTLSAAASHGGRVFSKWLKDGVVAGGGTDIQLTVDGDSIWTAVYVEAPAPSLLVNGGFESGLDGWSASGNLALRDAAAGSVPEGRRFVAFNSGNSTPNGSLNTVIGTTPGHSYRLTFDLGVTAFNTMEQRLSVELSGRQVLASGTFAIKGAGAGVTRWYERSLAFTADGEAATLRFRDVSTVTNAIDLLLDDVTLTDLGMPAGLARVEVLSGVETTLPDVPLIACEAEGVRISMPWREPGFYELQRSRDLIRWESVDEIHLAAPGAVDFLDPAPLEARMFYRIGWRP